MSKMDMETRKRELAVLIANMPRGDDEEELFQKVLVRNAAGMRKAAAAELRFLGISRETAEALAQLVGLPEDPGAPGRAAAGEQTL